jgi:hypothetical protein
LLVSLELRQLSLHQINVQFLALAGVAGADFVAAEFGVGGRGAGVDGRRGWRAQPGQLEAVLIVATQLGQLADVLVFGGVGQQ